MAKKTKKKKRTAKMKGRPRGGASVPCPRCKSDSSVIITRRSGVLSNEVVRTRQCRRGHKFHTSEVPTT